MIYKLIEVRLGGKPVCQQQHGRRLTAIFGMYRNRKLVAKAFGWPGNHEDESIDDSLYNFLSQHIGECFETNDENFDICF